MSRSKMKYHPRIGYTYVPSSKFRVRNSSGGYLMRTNAAGFRSDREFETERDADTFRVLLFGDSQTAGDGTVNSHRYSDLVEQAIPDVEVYNYGLSGTGPDQQFLAFEELANVTHDLVVIGLYVENIRRVNRSVVKSMGVDGIEHYYAKPYYEIEDDELVLKHVPVPKKGWALDALPAEYQSQVYNYSETNFYTREYKEKVPRYEALARSKPLKPVRDVVKNLAVRLSSFQPLPEYDSPDEPDWILLRRLLEMWIAASEVPVLIMSIPHYLYLGAPGDAYGYQERFTELAAGAGCHLYDPLPDLSNLSSTERGSLWSDADGHLSLRGHEVLAELLAPVITDVKAAETRPNP